ncbi:MAG: FtsX-like permease family protein, partial [Opitutales bacterium]|nr:FtsX-like permease family protein [Opitutales bacterium]
VQGMVMLMYDDVPAFAYAKGITAEEPMVTGLEHMLTPNSSLKLADDQVVIGENIAQRLGIQLDDTVTIYSPVSFEGLTHDEIIFPQELKVAGFFSAESYARDAVICSLTCMQKLYELEDEIHGMTLRVHKGVSLEPLVRALQQELGSEYVVVDWMHSNRDLLFTLRWEKTMMFFVLLFILLVASFSISSMLITNVVRKTREIGTVIAMGGRSWGIMGCFCLQSILIGVLGVTGGLSLGFTVLHYRDAIVRWLYHVLHWENAQHYLSQFTHLPVAYEIRDLVIISTFALLICIVAGLLPAFKAAHIDPAKALRYEQ